jgi:dienelactone hydrolase
MIRKDDCMADTPLPAPDPQAYTSFVRATGAALHVKDQTPATRKDWLERRSKLRTAMFEAMGPFPDRPCPLEAKIVGVLKRTGYRIEKILFQSRPDVWVTASAYVPETMQKKVPAVLVVHGHWPWARRDPVVQARCLGLVHLGFFVLAVDAFGAGERYPTPARGTYHGALFGSILWPIGQTLLGMQVYDNRCAVDYLRTRPEVDGDWLGITGASGGGNQSMYAGALDERFRAVVPVCSVGTYQAYLHAACCVCEVLPGALRFAEEGDVLSLVAPRALMVINATKDAYQFSVGEATRSIDRARSVFRLYGAVDKLRHAVFESGHDYSQAMREAMYGWMARWLRNEGDGAPIPEPKHTIETPEDLRCLTDAGRPKEFLFPPSFAAREARTLLARLTRHKPDHVQDWEATAIAMRTWLTRDVFGGFPQLPEPKAEIGKAEVKDRMVTSPVVLQTEPGLTLPLILKSQAGANNRQPACILLDLDGGTKALEHPLAAALLNKGWTIVAPDLRATGTLRPPNDAIGGSPDHNSAEHALWIGRPLLGQWCFDVLCALDWLALQPTVDARRVAVAGLGQAGIVALCAGGLFDDRVTATLTLQTPVSYISELACPAGTRMGLLAPGILKVGDIPQLAALIAPRRLVIADGVTSQARKLSEKYLREAFSFTVERFKLYKAETRLTLSEGLRVEDIAATVGI